MHTHTSGALSSGQVVVVLFAKELRTIEFKIVPTLILDDEAVLKVEQFCSI